MEENSLVFFEIFPWDKNFETNIKIIDEQHKQLVNILNKLAAHLANRSEDIALNEVFDELASYADYHFKTEEKIWSENFKDDEWFTKHEKTHINFIDEVVKLKSNDKHKPLDDVVHDIVSMLSKWLAYHILDTDKRMAIAVLNMQSGMSIEESKKASVEEMSDSRVIVDTVLKMYDTLSTRTLELMREKALRKKAEEALITSEERWKFILDSEEDRIWDWNIEHNTINKSEDDIFIAEITKNNLDSESKNTNIHPLDIERVRSDFQDHLSGKTEFYTNKHRILHKNGSWSWVLSRGKVVQRDNHGKALRMVGTNSDITERELASLIYKNSSQAIIVSDSNNNIISVNPAFSEITGYSEKEVIGRKPNILSSGKHDQKYFKDMWESIKSKDHWKGKIYNRRKNTDLYPEYLEINAVKDAHGEVEYYFALFNDITEEEEYKKERKQKEDYILQQSRMAQMGDMLGMIAHQWRQPLTIIGMHANNTLADIALDDFQSKKAEKYSQDILEQTQHLSQTIDDFRNFFKPDKEAITIEVPAVMTETYSIVKDSLKNNHIEFKTSFDSHSRVDVFKRELMQVFINIINNAKDALVGDHIENPLIEVKIYEDEKYVNTEVCDNGGGIEDSIIEKIFDPYFTTKDDKNGTGLGLYMGKIIIEDHLHGIIEANSTTTGTCIKVRLPKEG